MHFLKSFSLVKTKEIIQGPKFNGQVTQVSESFDVSENNYM